MCANFGFGALAARHGSGDASTLVGRAKESVRGVAERGALGGAPAEEAGAQRALGGSRAEGDGAQAPCAKMAGVQFSSDLRRFISRQLMSCMTALKFGWDNGPFARSSHFCAIVRRVM